MPHFVKKFDINGVKTKQVACIELHGRPNAATKGAVGVLGMDVDSPTHEIYKCVGVMGGIYVWEVFSGGSGGSGGSLTVVDGGHYTPSVTDNGNGTMTISFTASKDGMAVVAPVTVTLPAGADGAHVVAIDEMGGDDTKTTYKMRFSDGSGYDFDVYHGQDGEDGTDGGHYTPSVTDNGNGTMTVSFTASTSDMPTINPVTITLPVPDDGENGGYYTPSVDTVTANTFKISFTASKSGMPAVGDVTITLPAAKDGNDGDDGVGIESVVQTTTSTVDGGENVITVTLTNGNKSTFKVKNGSKGSKGDAGNGIKSIAKTSTSGLVDTYTITFTDNTTATFTVTNGKDGAGEAETVNICLPSSDVAVVGREYNIYKDSIIFGNRPYDEYDVAMYLNDSTVQTYTYHDVFRFVPAKVGTYTLTVYIRDYLGKELATKTMTIEVVANAETVGKNVLFIGDSLTAAAIYPPEIQDNLSAGGITSVGTIETTRTIDGVSRTSKHEGRNGWATWDYAGTKSDSLSKFNSESNVFRNPSTNKFDLAYYMQTYHSGVTLHAVCINLGTNGIGADTSVMNGLNEMVARIKEYDSALPILIHLTIPEARQDYRADKSGGKNTTHDHMRRCWRSQVNAYMNAYDGKVANVHVVPVYCNMDIVHDFPTEEVTVSARNPAKIHRASDGHPNTYGYLKMADVYYAHLLKYMRDGGEVEEPDEPDEPTVVNLADPSKVAPSGATPSIADDYWWDGYYISSKAITSRAEIVVPNKIHVTKNQRICIKGFQVEGNAAGSTARNMFRVLYCDASGKALITEIQPATSNTVAGTGKLEEMDQTELERGVYSWIPAEGSSSAYLNTLAYIRVCGAPINGDANNIIITVDEPIV